MDETTRQVFSLLFVMATVVLVYTARYFAGRRGGRRTLRELEGVERLQAWTTQSIESGRPLHLGFGGAGVGDESAPVALASAEFYRHVIQGAATADNTPIVSTASPVSVPLAQDTLRRAGRGDSALSRAMWLPGGRRSLAYAAGMGAALDGDDPAAQVLAGSHGPELALMLDAAHRRGQGSLAASDQLEGQAVAYAMADAVLLGEELYAAPAAVSAEGRAAMDAAVLDVWRSLLILGATAWLLFDVARRVLGPNWLLAAAIVAIALALVLILMRRA